MSLTLEAAPDAALVGRWSDLRANEPKLRIRDAAARLDVGEAELVATIPGVIRLRPDWAALLTALTGAGEVMALTRNASCVHERHGTYRDASVQGMMGLVLGEEIDLRLFLSNWACAFFVPAGQSGSPRGSLQIFDKSGEAVHKVFATEATPTDALPAIAAQLADPDAAPFLTTPRAPAAPPLEDAAIDADGLRQAWSGLRDTHDFFPMLRRFKVAREQALRLAGPANAQPLPVTAIATALHQASADKLPIMIFVGNQGCIQIHTGPVNRIVPMGEWINVLDPAFNLHLSQPAIASVWLVRKPTDDGLVTSVEAFDARGEVILMMFGKRKPGQPEDTVWRAMAEGMTEAGHA